MEQLTCSCCGCSWDEESGYYRQNGVAVQPCIECRLDSKSIAYLNNRDSILEAQRAAYYADHEAKKAYYRQYRRLQRAQATA